jgi:hypothetical protein
MNRPGWITAVIVVQALWALALMGIGGFLLTLARIASPEVSAGLKTGATVLVVLALFASASWYGLWKETLWGWWLALLGDFALLAIFLYSMVDDGLGHIDWEMAGITVISAFVPILLLVPVVRKFYWRATARQALTQD